ncbi:hypothetical protein GCM10020221_06380 [Streptomyces thioluteus]|uniref:Uncharacterized protein n=1 Tax=Streptomyces thioluteus TaxID=66431 RepID=A0ABN3WES3_STRTU
MHRETDCACRALGGIAMFGGLCAGLLVASHLSNLKPVFETSNEPRALLSGGRADSGCSACWTTSGAWDALVKLRAASMIARAGVMVLQGLTDILWLPVPGHRHGGAHPHAGARC